MLARSEHCLCHNTYQCTTQAGLGLPAWSLAVATHVLICVLLRSEVQGSIGRQFAQDHWLIKGYLQQGSQYSTAKEMVDKS